MNHYCVLMNVTRTFKDCIVSIKSKQKVIIRSKGELTFKKIENWIKNNNTEFISYEFLQILGDGPNDRVTRIIHEGV